MPEIPRPCHTLNRWLDHLTAWSSWLLLPLALLLLVQWPLRDGIGAYARQANDTAQWLFALYVAVAMRHTTRVGGHLATDPLSSSDVPAWRLRLQRVGHSMAVLPFALFVVISGWPMMKNSVSAWESFPDTANPGYFIIKFSAWLLALLMVLQAGADLFERKHAP